jgi:hypothetical protein
MGMGRWGGGGDALARTGLGVGVFQGWGRRGSGLAGGRIGGVCRHAIMATSYAVGPVRPGISSLKSRLRPLRDLKLPSTPMCMPIRQHLE